MPRCLGGIFNSIRGRTIAAVVILHAVLMALVVVDMVNRQQEFMLLQLQREGASMAQTLALNAPGWLISNDLTGLEELVNSQRSAHNLQLAMILDSPGRVRASTDLALFNLVLDDAISRQLMAAGEAHQAWHDNAVDSSAKIVAGGKTIGHTRVILDAAPVQAELAAVTRQGIIYTLFAIVLGGVVAWLTVRTVTARLARLSYAADRIAAGHLDVVLAKDKGEDEVAHLTRDFAQMVTALDEDRRKRDAAEEQLLYHQDALRVLNEELEQRVADRTSDLASANREISALNRLLHSENQRMSAELEVTRRIQQMVLPPQSELDAIKELDIAGFMEAADEVGGDYYDVLQYNGRVKFGIGDVTGHGLESGVLMIMVQTAVRTLLISGITDPTLFITVLNEVIYHNVQRIQSDKNLTLSLLDYHAQTLTLTGQHEEVLIIRQNGLIERIDTLELGFLVGLVPEISRFVQQRSISLVAGDCVVLYTDGIVEAFDSTGTPYGVDRLCRIISASWQETAAEIRQAVIDDLRVHAKGCVLADDISLLVLKQR